MRVSVSVDSGVILTLRPWAQSIGLGESRLLSSLGSHGCLIDDLLLEP